jgi:bifunctional DNase/RNase
MRPSTAFVTIALLASVLIGAAGTAGKSSDPLPLPPPGSQEVAVVGVVIAEGANQPAVLLEGKRDHRRLIMAIGLAEATGIAVPLEGLTPPRPLTHDLFLTLFGRLEVVLTRVVISDLRDDTYYATVHLTAASKPMKLDARPSDAIALALRAKVPVVVEDRVFDKAGSAVPGHERI